MTAHRGGASAGQKGGARRGASGRGPFSEGELDSYDIRILEELQADASRSVADIGAAVNLSHNACWRRIRRLEEEGFLVGRVALVDPARAGFALTVFVAVRVAEHSDDYLAKFAKAVAVIPEVVEFYRMSGDLDYLVKILLPSIGDYDRVYRKLIRAVPIRDVSASFSMEVIKVTTAVPVRHAR